MEMFPSDGESNEGQEKLNNPSSDSGDSGLAEDDSKKSSSSTDTRPRTNLGKKRRHCVGVITSPCWMRKADETCRQMFPSVRRR